MDEAISDKTHVQKEAFGEFCLRAIGGGSLQGAHLFRSCELSHIDNTEALFLVNELGISSIYDIRNQWEVAAHAQPYLVGTKTIALEPSCEHHKKDANKRLVAGVIESYGKPEERMKRNYRRYVREYPLIGTALRSIATEGVNALVHCVNGKDRTGVLCAVLLRAAGLHPDDVMDDYLKTNTVNKLRIAQEAENLSPNMTSYEKEILMSFLEARPAYLQAFFDEVDESFGSFDNYIQNELHLNSTHISRLQMLLLRSEVSR